MSSELEKSNEQILKDLISAFSSLKQKMEDPNYAALDSSMKNMLENQRDMKADVKDLKKRLLNPVDGVIVKTNQNTAFREEYAKLQEERDGLVENVAILLRWKALYIKVFWAIFTAALGIFTFLISESIINQ